MYREIHIPNSSKMKTKYLNILKSVMLGGVSALSFSTFTYAACPTGTINNTTLTTENCTGPTTWSGGYFAIQSGSTVTTTIAAGSYAFVSDTNSNLSYFLNNGVLNSTAGGIELKSGTVLNDFTNNGSINFGSLHTSSGVILVGNTQINTFTNTGSINGTNAAIDVLGTSRIQLLNNSGSLSGSADALILATGSTIDKIVNTGSIIGLGANRVSILNPGTIRTLENYQGAAGSGGSALKLWDNLPQNYNVIINGAGYGQLSADNNINATSTTFGVSTLTDTRKLIQGQVYSSVLSGISTANLNNTTGKVGDRGTFTLRQNGANTWDMTIDGLWTPVIGYMNPNVANTYTAVSANRDAVSGAIHQRYAVLNAVMEYDCSRFDKYGVCLSFQARATGWGDQTTGAGVLNIAKRVTENVRAGVYLDYQAAQATPFATNGYNGGVQWGYNNPTFGGYVGWSDKADGTGIQARVSGGYNPGKITVNRAILDYAEPGSGTAGLNAYYAYGVAGYGVSVGNGVVVTPYGGLRYTDVTRNAYTENFVPGWVLFPLAYNAYYEQLITGLTGAKFQAMLTDKFGVNIALGGEFDFNRNANGYGGYSYAPGMEAWGVNHGGYWNGVRPAGIVGAFYDVNKNDRLMLNAYVGEQAWSSRTYTNLLAGYQVAF